MRTEPAIIEGERHPLGVWRQVAGLQELSNQLVIAVEGEREIGVLARDAVEPLQEVSVVSHPSPPRMIP